MASDGKTIVRAGMWPKIVPVVDRTGAGDAFAIVDFLSQWILGKPLTANV